MNKIYLPLFFCLFFFSRLVAQTDSNAAPAVRPALQNPLDTIQPKKDTNASRPRRIIKRSPPVVPPILDTGSLSPRIAPKPAALSPTALNPGPPKDSDSIQLRRDAFARAATREDDSALALARRSRMIILGANTLFDFTGLPVVENADIHRPDSKDSVFYLLLGILFYFALVRIFFEKYFNNLLTLFFRVSLRQQQIREQVLQTPLPSLLLNGLFVVTGGLYAAYLLHYFRYAGGINFWILYLDCMLILGVVYLIKFLVLKFCGWVFSISRATDIYIFIVFLVNKMLGIFLLPFLILISFSSGTAHEVYITLSIAMVFVFLAYRVLASFRPIRNEIKLTPFHFFLYLCAFEIAPLLLIYKVLLAYLEKAS
jgi:hypothetical protein